MRRLFLPLQQLLDSLLYTTNKPVKAVGKVFFVKRLPLKETLILLSVRDRQANHQRIRVVILLQLTEIIQRLLRTSAIPSFCRYCFGVMPISSLKRL